MISLFFSFFAVVGFYLDFETICDMYERFNRKKLYIEYSLLRSLLGKERDKRRKKKSTYRFRLASSISLYVLHLRIKKAAIIKRPPVIAAAESG